MTKTEQHALSDVTTPKSTSGLAITMYRRTATKDGRRQHVAEVVADKRPITITRVGPKAWEGVVGTESRGRYATLDAAKRAVADFVRYGTPDLEV